MNDVALNEIIIRLKLIEASLKINEINQANEYLNVLIDEYKMGDLENTKQLIISNEQNKAIFLIGQIIKSYENIFGKMNSGTKIETQSNNKSQINQDKPNLIPFKKNNKWGFNDSNNVLIIDCQYDEVLNFQEGKAAVKKNSYWGFINTNGDICSDFIFERVNSFCDGMASVCIRSTKEYSISKNSYRISEIDKKSYKVEKQYFLKWGFINHTGQIVIPIQYANVKDFSEGLAMVETLINYSDGMSWFEKKYKIDFIDKTGRNVIKLNNYVTSSGWDSDFWQYHNKAYTFIDGRCKVYTPYVSKEFNQDVIINKSGDIILSNLNYDRIMSYSEGLAAVAHVTRLVNVNGEDYFEEKWGFVDLNGNEIIDCKFNNVGSFKEGLAPVCLNQKWGFINKEGFVVISPKFEAVRQFSEGLAAAYQEVPNLDSNIKQKLFKWGFIDLNGKTIIPFIYDGYSLSYEEFIPGCASFKKGLVRVQKGGKGCTINKEGTLIEE